MPLALQSISPGYDLKDFKGYGSPNPIPKSSQLPEILFAGQKRDKPTVSLHSLTSKAMNHVSTLELPSNKKFKHCIISMQIAKTSKIKKYSQILVVTDSKKIYLVSKVAKGLKVSRVFDLGKNSPGRGVKCFYNQGNWAVMWDEGEKGRLFKGRNWVVKFDELSY